MPFLIRTSYARAFLCGLLICICAALPAAARQINATPDTFKSALNSAKPGDEVLLAPGDYAASLTRRLGTPDQHVVIRSAQLDTPAVFKGLWIKGEINVTFEDLIFDYQINFDKEKVLERRYFVHIPKGEGITFRRILFDGDLARAKGKVKAAGNNDNYGTALALFIRDSKQVIVENCTFRTFYRAISIQGSDQITVKDNDFYNMRSDGITLNNSSDVRIEGNYFHDFERHPQSKDHPDMIQAWSTGAFRVLKNVSIRDNILHGGKGNWVQSIFMRNEIVDSGGGGRDMFYRNIDISGNVIINDHLHGITLGESEGVTIRNNTLLRSFTSKGAPPPTAALGVPTIRVSPRSDRVTVRGNITPLVAGAKERPDWAVTQNLPLIAHGNTGSPAHYNNVFVSPAPKGDGNLQGYAYKPGAPADGITYGSALLQAGRITDIVKGKGAPDYLLRALPHLSKAPGTPQSIAALERSYGPSPELRIEYDADYINRVRFYAPAAAGAAPLWELPSGQELRARNIEVDFTVTGLQTLILHHEDGTRETVELTLDSPLILGLADGKLDGNAILTPQDAQALPMITGPDGTPVVGVRGGAVLPQNLTGNFNGATRFALTVRLRTLKNGIAAVEGTVLRSGNSVALGISNSGVIQAALMNEKDARPVIVSSAPRILHDGAWHDIGLYYEAGEQTMTLVLDGKPITRTRLSGRLRGFMPEGLMFGDKTPSESYDGVISSFSFYALKGGISPTITPETKGAVIRPLP